jgi:hypothetical protein
MVDRARVYGDNSANGWVNLTNLTPNVTTSYLNAKLGSDGTLKGNIEKSYYNVKASIAKSNKDAAENEEKYIEDLDGEQISDYSFSDTNLNKVYEKYNFFMQPDAIGDMIYINASVFPFISKNPFSEQERKLPVEFSYPEMHSVNCLIDISDGYKVEELPDNVNINACENGVSFQYVANVNENILEIMLVFKVNRILYSVAEYQDLRTFFGLLSSLNNSKIILKK